AERDLRKRDQFQTSGLIQQSRIGQRLNLVQAFKLVGAGDVVEQLDGREFGIDQSIGLLMLFTQARQRAEHYHKPPRHTSMRRKVSYREIMSPWDMISNGERPLKNSLWLVNAGKPLTLSGLSNTRRRAAWMLRT